jgi:hypothetical protein
MIYYTPFETRFLKCARRRFTFADELEARSILNTCDPLRQRLLDLLGLNRSENNTLALDSLAGDSDLACFNSQL